MKGSGLESRYHRRRGRRGYNGLLLHHGEAAAGCLWWITMCLLIMAVSGWGTIGHEMVANLAWHRLSNRTKTAVVEILGNYTNGTNVAGSPLASVADWADRVRYYYHWSGPLHYIDVRDDEISGGCPALMPGEDPKNECHFVYERDCPNDFCVSGAIQNYTSQLSKWSQAHAVHYLRKRTLWSPPRRRSTSTGTEMKEPPTTEHSIREALMFVTHFVGDIHQPLHASRTSDKGGNDFHVHFDFPITRYHVLRHGAHHQKWNLHSVWDTGMIERTIDRDYSGSREAFEKHLENISHSVEYTKDVVHWLQCPDGRNKDCTEAWGEESFQAALKFAYMNSDNTEVVDGSALDESYYETRLEVVKKQIIAAGIRLAVTLECTLNPMYESSKLMMV